MNYKDIVRTAKAIFKEKHEPLLKKYFEGDIERKEEQISQWEFWYMNHFTEGAEWASEQFAQEKQQWIDKACEWLKNNIDDYYTTGEFEEWFDEMFEDFKQAMKGE